MTLALLITAVTGAWADEPKVYTTAVDMTSLKLGDILCEGATVTTTSNLQIRLNEGRWQLDGTTQSMSLILNALPVTLGTNATISMGSYTFSPANEQGQAGNAWIVTETNEYGAYLSGITTGPAEPTIDVKWDAKTKTGSFVMPAFDVEIAPIYASTAVFATDGEPTAIEGIIAGEAKDIVKAGTVATTKIGEADPIAQGTVMYAVTTENKKPTSTTGFNATVPTGAVLTGSYTENQTVYVWYYIKGIDAAEGETATAENTFNDSEICETPLTVTVLSNKFNIQFKAANANTIEAGKATVTVGGTAATVTEGKLQGVKMGSEVKLKANTGYKFRKVEVKKAAPALITLMVTGVATKSINYAEGDTWQQAIERPENAGSGWKVQGNYILNGALTLFTKGGGATYVYVNPEHTIDATKNYSLEAD